MSFTIALLSITEEIPNTGGVFPPGAPVRYYTAQEGVVFKVNSFFFVSACISKSFCTFSFTFFCAFLHGMFVFIEFAFVGTVQGHR